MEKAQISQEWEWLDQVLNESGSTHNAAKEVRYLCKPQSKNPEFLLPIETPASTAAALAKYNDNRKIEKKLKTLSMATIARTGVLQTGLSHYLVGQPVIQNQWDLVTYLATNLGEQRLIAAVGIGPSRRNRKPVLQLLRPDGITVGFAKIGWSPLTKKLLANETTILQKIENKLPSWALAPKVLLQQDWNDSQVTVFTSVPTSFRSGKSDMTAHKISQFAASLGTSHSTFEEIPAIGLWRSSAMQDEVQFDTLVTKHQGKNIELGIWHGDLTPWNTSTKNGVTSLWDWEFAAESRPIGFDLLHRQFEIFRRDPTLDTDVALTKTEDASKELLKDLTKHSEAVFDLYLCELLHRELELEGQKWESSNISPLLPSLQKLLKQKGL